MCISILWGAAATVYPERPKVTKDVIFLFLPAGPARRVTELMCRSFSVDWWFLLN